MNWRDNIRRATDPEDEIAALRTAMAAVEAALLQGGQSAAVRCRNAIAALGSVDVHEKYEFPCPDCRGVTAHVGACLYLLADQQDRTGGAQDVPQPTPDEKPLIEIGSWRSTCTCIPGGDVHERGTYETCRPMSAHELAEASGPGPVTATEEDR